MTSIKSLWRKFYAQVALLSAVMITPIPVLAQTKISPAEANNWLILIQNHGLSIVIVFLTIGGIVGIFKWMGKTIDKILETSSKDRDADRKTHTETIDKLNSAFDKRNDRQIERLDKMNQNITNVLMCYIDKREREDNGKDTSHETK